LERTELIVVQNLKEGRDREVGEDLNNVDLLGVVMIVIEVCFLSLQHKSLAE
jgi:hypothetical protein